MKTMAASDLKHPSIYISHAWGGESEILVNKIVDRFEREGIPLTLDKKDLGYRQSIGQFMLNLGKADAIILVVSNKYLHSEYCMFELLQIYESDNIHSRIFPIVLEEVKIAKSTERLDLVRYWEDQTIQLEDKIRELQSLSHIEGITDDLNLYHNIRNKIAKLTSILKDINTLNVELHQESDFAELVNAVKSKVVLNEEKNENKSSISTKPTLPRVQKKQKDSKRRWRLFIWLPLIFTSVGLFWVANKLFLEDKEVLTNSEALFSSSDASEPADSTTVLISKSDIVDRGNDRKTSKSDFAAEAKTAAVKDEIGPKPEKEKASLPTNRNQGTQEESDLSTRITEEESTANLADGDGEEVLEEALDQEAAKESYVEIRIPNQLIEGIFTKDVSSNQVEKGDVFYIKTTMAIVSDGVEVVRKGARIKTTVSKSKSSRGGARASLGVIFESVESVSGEWIALQYPELSDIKRGEVIFEKGLKISKLRLKESTIKMLQ